MSPTTNADKQHHVDIGLRLRAIRERRGMTLSQVATKLQENNPDEREVDLRAVINKISRVELASRRLKYPFAKQLSQVLGFDADSLFAASETPPNQTTLFLSGEVMALFEEAREKIAEDVGIRSLSNEQLIEYMLRKVVLDRPTGCADVADD